MAKKRGDSKLAVAGTITLGLAIVGVMLAQQPLKSARPPSLEGALKPQVVEGVVQARLWEDPLEAARRVATFNGEAKKNGNTKSDVDRVAAIRQEIDGQIGHNQGQPITVLLVMTEGGTSGESRETRIRDRYAIGSALNIACYVPQHDDQLSYVEWRDRAGMSRVLPYEWYGQGPRKCSLDPDWPPAVLVLWISSEITGDHPIKMLSDLTESILCERSAIGACRRGGDEQRTALLDLHREQHVRFKIMGPRSSSGFRDLLEEAAGFFKGGEDHVIWANAGGRVELYSPWATATPQLLTQSISVTGKPTGSAECVSSDASREQLCWILLRAGIELKHSIGSDGQLFESLVYELERRRVKFERDAVILIAEWDSFYGRVMPVEFTATVCHRIAHRPSEENWAIEPKRLALIRSKCDRVDQAIDLQVNDPVGTKGLGLNIWRYSYLRGLDGDNAGRDKGDSGKGQGQGNGAKQLKNTLLDIQLHERPVGTSQFDYAQRLAARIERDIAEEVNLQRASSDPNTGNEEPVRKPPAAIGILGSDAYDALLILQAMRERFPGVVFFTTDLDSRLVYADDYRWTRNLVIASHYGLELYGDLQRDVPPFRSSYQTSAYFATLQAVGHVRPLGVCPPAAGQTKAPTGAVLSPCGYQANRVSGEAWFSGVESPRLFEVGRHGAVDLTVGAVDKGYTLHAPRVDLSNDGPQTNGRKPSSGILYGTAGLVYVMGFVLLWTKPTINRWMTAHRGVLALSAVGTVGLVFVIDEFLFELILRHHDEGEPFYWLEGVSIWPTEIFRALATVLAIGCFIKAWRDLRSNSEEMTDSNRFGVPAETDQAGEWRQYLAMVQWVLSPRGGEGHEQVGTLWQRYRMAGEGRHRLTRLFLLAVIYGASFLLLWRVMGAEDLSGPCRGTFSCQIDFILVIASYVCLVVLNLFVFDAVLLCRRWIGSLTQATDGWPPQLIQRLALQSLDNLAKAQELMKLELIAQRTEVVNRLVRYPFIVLLIMIIARNEYFDDWHFPLTMIVGWSVNVFLALAAALLLYRAAEQARNAAVAKLNRMVLKGLEQGTGGDAEVKLTRQVIEDIEAVGRGAFVPLWQQPVVESSVYSLMALAQYLYLS